jgi:GT2 family glycosyltransferase
MSSKEIVVVVVLYKRKLEASQTINSLSAAFATNPELLDCLRILLWDNSPRAIDRIDLAFPCDYRHAGRNEGTSGAYNYAMEFAEAEGASWLLLLDQDTMVSGKFLPRMLEYSHLLQGRMEIGSVVPFISSHGSLVSPRLLGRFHQMPQIAPTFNGICRRKAFAVNSATLMRVAALREIGGYSVDFWLDLSDIYVFQAMYRKGKYIYVAGDLTLEHSVTNMNFDGDMAPERYRNFLAAEGAYVDLYSSAPERAFHVLRLMARTIRQRRRHKNKVFSEMTWEYFRRRVLDTRATRLQSWQKQLLLRDIPAIKDGRPVG